MGKTIHEITSFAPPSGFKSYRPRAKNSLLPYVLLAIGILVASIFIHLFLEPATATAKTLEAKDCMTNECVLRIVCGEETNYINVKEFCD